MKAFVHISSIDSVLSQFGHLQDKISPDEWSKITRHSHDKGKNESLAIRLQLLGLCEFTGISIDDFPVHYLSSGKPVLKKTEWFMSWSHTKGVAATVISECPIGIDVEADRQIHAGLYRKALHPTEIDTLVQLNEYQQKEVFLKKWVIKEAYLKMAGLTIAHHIQSVLVHENGSQVEYIRPNGIKTVNKYIWHRFEDQDWYHVALVSEQKVDFTFLGAFKTKI